MSGHVDGFTNIGGVSFQTAAIKSGFTGHPVSQPYIQIVDEKN